MKPVINEIAETYRFYQLEHSSLSIADFVIELRCFADKCKFGTHLETALRDKFVCGISNRNLRAKLLQQDKLTFDKAVKIAHAYEAANGSSEIMENSVKKVNKVFNKKIDVSKGPEYLCSRCGRKHAARQCPAYGKVCKKFNNRGHFAEQCKTSKGVVRKQYKKANRIKGLDSVEAEDEMILEISGKSSSIKTTKFNGQNRWQVD